MSNTRRSAAEHKPHVVYVLRDKTGTVLYVGVTMNPRQRIGSHRREQPWREEIDVLKTTLSAEMPFEEALTLEEQTINALAPLHNKRRKNGSRYIRLGIRDEVYADREGVPRPNPVPENHAALARIMSNILPPLSA